MNMDQLLQTIRSFDGLLEFAPTEGDEFPPTAWGDHFFYYAPGGQVPKRQQPYATIVTKNYPDDSLSDLDKPGRWRLNIHVGTTTARELTDKTAVPTGDQWDFAAPDVVFPHPLYRHQGWVSIVNPGARTSMLAVRLLRQAHEAARHRLEHRRSRERIEREPGAGGTR
ncbi:DUF6194 family protein [Gordonia sp. N1V]|uniref:DUF6194 family protein n=1 Tax=Gordonia sp. N1V TaxID=3034163 RepID=UPI0023E23D16|nr:DUF6194 family protein [Gordonia sp. N1V]MDF3285249.1 DUF6194 family protein [Gordonia sp. N1V]